jgi:hypothetical protein
MLVAGGWERDGCSYCQASCCCSSVVAAAYHCANDYCLGCMQLQNQAKGSRQPSRGPWVSWNPRWPPSGKPTRSPSQLLPLSTAEAEASMRSAWGSWRQLEAKHAQRVRQLEGALEAAIQEVAALQSKLEKEEGKVQVRSACVCVGGCS